MKDVILIGLGEFGKKTIELFNEIETERKGILPLELREEINVFPIGFKNNRSFNYVKISEAITHLVDRSDSKNGKRPFSYVFVGDLYEDITSNYALDYAMIPMILDQGNILRRDSDNVLGFFTFSDRLESQLKCTPEKMKSILSFFKKIEKVDVDGFYCPRFKDVSGHRIERIECPRGPFSRNYIVVTPGDENSVLAMTSRIFAERVFYELYYLLDEYKERANQVDALRAAKSRSCFSSFTMGQISRLAEMEKYYLTYCLEDSVTDYLLRDEVKGINLDALENKFLSMLDIIERKDESTYKRSSEGYSVKFPIDRAVSLFVNKFRNELRGLIPAYIKQEYKDDSEYVEICKKKIHDKLYELLPYYDDFVKSEIQHMHLELEKGYVNLFKVDKLIGNIQTYIKYIEDLKNIFDSWTEDLIELSNSFDEIDLQKHYENVQKKIRKYQKSFIYKLPFFRPVRRMLINNAILELPLKEYLENEIKGNLVESFLKQWGDRSNNSVSPVHTCDVFINDLYVMKNRLQNKKIMIAHKKEFISKMPEHYYIISQLKQDDYTNLLEKLYDKKFGPVNQSQIENIARELFNRWTVRGENISKDRQDITKDPSGFIRHIDSYLFEKGKELFSNMNEVSEDFEKYASQSVKKLVERIKQLSDNSFITQEKDFYISENAVLFKPELKQEDQIDVCIDTLPPETNRIKVNKDFTLGTVVYFQDHLYMEYRNLRHYESLFKKYEDEKDYESEIVYADLEELSEDDEPVLFSSFDIEENDISTLREESFEAVPEISVPSSDKTMVVEETVSKEENSFENSFDCPSTFADDDELDIYNLHSRMLLKEYFDEDFRFTQYQKIFGESVSELSEGNINAIAKSSDLADLLRQMDIEKIHDYCKEINLEDVFSDKETQIETILAYLEDMSED